MNITYKKIIAVLIFLAQTAAGLSLPEVGNKLIPGGEKKFFTTLIEERQERLTARKKQLALLQSSDREFTTTINATTEELKGQITQYEQELHARSDNEYAKQRLELSLELFQILNDVKSSREQDIALLKKLNRLDEEFLADPDMKRFAQGFLGKDRSSYSFDDDLLTLHEMMSEREKDIATYTEQETNAANELENRKRAAQEHAEAYQAQKNKKEQEGSFNALTPKQKTDIDALKELVFANRKSLDDMRISEANNKLALVKTKLINAKLQYDVLKNVLGSVKPLTEVSEADIALANEELEKKRSESFGIKEALRQEIEKIGNEQKIKERNLEILAKRYNISLGAELDEWTKEPRRSPIAYIALATVGELDDQLLLTRRKKELLEAHLALEEEKLRNEQLRINVKDSFFKIINNRLGTEDAVGKEIKKYEMPKVENRANLALFKERQNTLTALITSAKKAQENIKNKIANAQAEKNTVFKDSPLDFEQYLTSLKNADSSIQEQIDYLGKIVGVYTDIIGKITNAGKHIDFINSELSSITIWYRPENAISWSGIKNSLPDMQAFVKDISDYLKTIKLSATWERVKSTLESPWKLISFLIKFFLLIVLLMVIRLYLPHITEHLVSLEGAPAGIRWVSILMAMFLGFIMKHLVSIVIWITCFIILLVYPFSNPYHYILFYLISIPYLLYLANRFMKYLVYFNEKYNYCFLSKDYQERFVIVVSSLLYATIVIVFFREAFILGNYHKSELPTILLAINFIIFQIAAILLLSKDQILSLISTKSDFGQWLYKQVDTHYYLLQLFLIAVIVMSNPYVGYGRLVLFVLVRLFYTIVLLQLLLWIQEWFKRVSSRFFFYFDVDEEIARDRFFYAKTLYGIFVVIIFVAFTFLGLLIAARIWHWPEVLLKVQKWSDVMLWIKTPFLLEGTQTPISIFTILKIFGFLFAGAMLAFALNRFVLGRIFDILLVDSGVQNTIESLLRYLIIITAIILGFRSVGLGDLVWYLLGALILGIGWVIKDPAADLIAYFILIVQRPVKVGDYIYMDENTNGVVRRITPRSVEIRRKNSTTIVVPNVTMTTRPLANWNHARGFIAFDDIMVTVPYKVDPGLVRELLLRVLDESRVVLKNPRPIVRLENFSDLGFTFLIRGFLSSNHTLDMWDVASDVRLAIVKRLRENGIDIAYPVRIMVSNSALKKDEF